MKSVLTMALVVLGVAAHDRPAVAQDLLPQIADIIDRGEIRVGMIDADAAPMVFTDGDGQIAGYDAAIAAEVANALGIRLTIVRTEKTYQAVVDQVARGDVDIGISYITRSVQRARRLLFTDAYLTQHLTLLVNRVHASGSEDPCPTGDEFIARVPDTTIGAERDSAYASRLLQLDPDLDLREFDDFGSMVDAVRDGTIAMAFQGEIVARYHLTENPSLRVYVALCVLDDWQENIAIAVNRKDRDLIPLLNILLDHIHIKMEGDTIGLRIDPWAH
ncbi:MAG: amino acid ABC transporter substrate-binding protein [Hyphomicrobiales bacterium]|nr:amino acid ABC transporter substrate-binding protein [Hyphomicrobiales bacterium]